MAEHTGSSDNEVGERYEEFVTALTEAAVAQFEITEDEAEELAHGVLMATILQGPRITDLRTWIHAAMSLAAARHHERRTAAHA